MAYFVIFVSAPKSCLQIQNERMEEQDKGNYSADNIQVLEGLEAVRKGPQCTLEMWELKDFII